MRIGAIQSISTVVKYSNPSFGRMIAGEDFSEDVINEAKRILSENEKVNVDRYKKDLFECWNDAKIQPLEWVISPFAYIASKVADEDSDEVMQKTRLGLGLSTFGITELLKLPEAGIRKLVDNVKAKKFAQNVERCILAIMRERRDVMRP